jgi:hypothetical protein
VLGQRDCDVRLRLDREARTAFGATGSDDATATDRFHTNEKTVSFFTASDGWLIGTFHDDLLLKYLWIMSKSRFWTKTASKTAFARLDPIVKHRALNMNSPRLSCCFRCLVKIYVRFISFTD